jgi:hypothetical protein
MGQKQRTLASRVLGILVVFFSQFEGTLLAGSQEQTALDRQQAVLTSQLNFAEKLADTHGRYRVVRDLYLTGAEGVLPLSKDLFASITKWLNTWVAGLGERTQGDWLNAAGGESLRSFTQQQSSQIEEIAVKYEKLLGAARRGHVLAKALPRLNMDEYKKERARGHGDDIFMDSYQDQLTAFNEQLNTLTQIFAETEAALNSDSERSLIQHLRVLNEGIAVNMQMLTSLYSMYYPELESQVVAVERLMATQKALEPILANASRFYSNGLQQAARADYLAAEELLKQLKDFRALGFAAMESEGHDQQRVSQVKALVDTQISDLTSNLEIKIASRGGRAPALRAYIKRYAMQGASTPLNYCRRTLGKLSAYRHYYDCNLFRTNVAPFLNRLDELDVGALEEIVKGLRKVYQGPLQPGAQP